MFLSTAVCLRASNVSLRDFIYCSVYVSVPSILKQTRAVTATPKQDKWSYNLSLHVPHTLFISGLHIQWSGICND